MNNIDYFRNAKYGLMIHFGLYSLLGGFYKGKKGPAYAEWIQAFHKIPVSEMKTLAKAFDPIYFNADEICDLAVKCGMKYIVITAKHHEGFALYKSEADSFNICDATPFGRDIISEMSGACRKYGLKLGLYYSQCIDWNEKHGGGYKSDPEGAAGVSWENSWDFPDKSEKDYGILFNKKILPQIKELMTNYGDIFLVWFDMPLDTDPDFSSKIYETVKKLQPDCLINSRLGNGFYDYVSLGDNEIPEKIPEDCISDHNDIYGFKRSPYGLYESACTLNRSWGYSSVDNEWKSPEKILENRLRLEKTGINYLINAGLDWVGRVPYRAAEILLETQELYKKVRCSEKDRTRRTEIDAC